MKSGNRFLVMLGSDFSSPGGMTAVVRMYHAGGLFDRWPIRFLPTYQRADVVNKVLTAAKALGRFMVWLGRGEVGWVHAHVAARGSFWRKSLFLALARLAGAKTVFHLHTGSFPDWYESRNPLARSLIRAVFRFSDRVIVLTPTWEKWVNSVEPRARTAVLGNPVSLPDAVSERIPGRVLFLGRLRETKGVYDLLEAVALLKDTVPDLQLVCGGDGDLDSLRGRAVELGMDDRLVLPGWVEGEQKAALLREAAVFVLPSYFEGLPVCVLEAMAYAVPVVATEVGGVRDAVGNESALLLPAGDVATLSKLLGQVLGDPELQRRMGEAGRRRVAVEFETSHVLSRLDGIYMELGMRQQAEGRHAAVQEA